jgi:2-iminobutanoate/2-iminopropanoate deaminase
MKIIETKDAPLPGGHYSQAIVSNGLVFVSGILPIVPNTKQSIPDGIPAQIDQIFHNLKAILNAANSDFSHLVNVQIFIPSTDFWAEINEAYQHALGAHKPARTIIPCGALHYGALVEINAVAEVKGI